MPNCIPISIAQSKSLQLTPDSNTVFEPAAFLHANSEAYEWLVNRIQMIDLSKEPETVLNSVVLAARFAVSFHVGRFADGAIENLLLEIGSKLDEFVAKDEAFTVSVARKKGCRRVLHVASHVLGIGGHTRMLYHWVRNDESSCHSLVLVNQRNLQIPQWLGDAVQSSGVDLVVLPSRSRRWQKAKWLRNIARQNADLVVLHHGAYDVVPTIAFAVRDCPPVTVLNHADHQFWLGSSVSDMVINLRTTGSDHTVQRRFVTSNTVLPIPLVDSVEQMSRQDARRALGIPEDQVVLLSIGRPEKYRPCGSYDFVSTAKKILERQPSTCLYVVGESAEGIAPYLRCAVHERLHFLGSIEDPLLYRTAADIYLESFPFGSNTALLEAALNGLPVVPAYAPLFPLLVAGDDAVQDLLTNPENEQTYVEQTESLVQQPEQRLERGKILRNRLLVDHVEKGWLNRLAGLYQETDCLSHEPQPIPVSSCSMTAADIGLSIWNVMADGRTNYKNTLEDSVGAELSHTAFVAKEVGDYKKARRFALRAIRHNPYRRASWRLLTVTVLGRWGKLIGRAFTSKKGI